MNKFFLIAACTLLCLGVLAQPATPAIIPQPVQLQQGQGFFTLPATITIATNSKEALPVAQMLGKQINKATGFNYAVKEQSEKLNGALHLVIGNNIAGIGQEGYQLAVTTTDVQLQANTAAGLFYGVQTLLQLLPPAIESNTVINDKSMAWQMPVVTITDYPRFGWRGLMLDVSRHFFTKQEVKDFIDNMVKYKYNMLHLHLTDDQGWRIEIKSLPKLTTVGAWRAERTGDWGTFTKPTPEEPKTYGGFYTQEDIKELVQYAKERFVSIMPEIDVPGHSMAMVAAYPELSCTPGTYLVNSGDRFMIWPGNGTFYGTIDNTLCPANEKVFEYLDKVFEEVAALFPFPYIHMGGDECYKGYWEKSDAVSALMKKEKLKDMHEVQSYFVKRVEKIVRSKGKQLMGWDEILEGGLAEGAAVMSWRGMKGGIEAAKMNRPVVMTPNTHTYVDLYQGDPVAEPPTYSRLLLNQSYKFEPVPDGVDPKLILGGQANLWSERLSTVRHAEYMLWPRGLAVAESIWSPKEKKDWNSFLKRTEMHFDRLDAAATNYSRSMYDAGFTVSKDATGNLLITLTKQVEDVVLHYSFDESFPDQFYPVYTKSLTVPKDASNLRVVSYRNGKQVGKQIKMPIAELKKRSERK